MRGSRKYVIALSRRARGTLFRVLSRLYSGPIDYYTRQPLLRIGDSWDNPEELKGLLRSFKLRKQAEAAFVNRASLLSAAAVLGIFSWPDVQYTLPAAKLLWYWSLFAAIFAMVSSAQQRLLQLFPDDEKGYSPQVIQVLLGLLVQPPPQEQHTVDVEDHRAAASHEPRPHMLWVWQTPIMLTSWSWVFLLLGLLCHLLTPLIRDEKWTTQCTVALLAIILGFLIVLNFFICAEITKFEILKVSKAVAKTK